MIYKFACKKNGKGLVKMVTDEGKEVWAETSNEVVDYAKNNFKSYNEKTGFPGETVKFEYTTKNGRYNVTKIMKIGQIETAKTYEPIKTTTNVLAPTQTKQPYTHYVKNEELIVKQTVLKASVEAVKVLSGHIDKPDDLAQVVLSLYDTFLTHITKK